ASVRGFAAKNLSGVPVAAGWVFLRTNVGVNLLACGLKPITDLQLNNLPEHPRFVFLATDLVSGLGWYIDRTNQIIDTVRKAVAVSSCFPGFFRPYTLNVPQRIALVDGGVDDNRGVEPVWKDHKLLLVSDGGEVRQRRWSQSFLWPLRRSAEVVWNQAGDSQKRWLLTNFLLREMRGAYWAIDSSPAHSHEPATSSRLPGYSLSLARDVIATIRTDYDAFSEAE